MFNLFPKIEYSINEFDTLKVVDINVSAKIKKSINSYRSLGLRAYVVKNGELPEIVSNRVYGSPRYSYIIISINNIHSIYDDWPRSDAIFKDFLIEKYGSISTAKTTTHSWYTGNDNTVSEEFWGTLTDANKYYKTIFEFETDLNDAKANINLIDFRYVIDFESRLQELLVSN